MRPAALRVQDRWALAAGGAAAVTVLCAMALGTSAAALPVVGTLSLTALALLAAALAPLRRAWHDAAFLASRSAHDGTASTAPTHRPTAPLVRPDTAPVTLADALTHAARDVERAHPGATVIIVTGADAPAWRDGLWPLVDAAHEAMTNAARHAGRRVRVEAHHNGGTTIVRVADTGRGFHLDVVPPDRRGIREGIVGRMQGEGGHATVVSTAGGTEVTLVLPAQAAP